MTRRLLLVLPVLLFPVFLAPAPSRAESTWVVAVGNNVGLPDETPLRYAERDAIEIATVLQRLGGVTPDRAVMVLGKDAITLRAILFSTTERIRLAEEEATLVVYYSGHADARGLHLAGSILPFADLERLVDDAPSKLRVLVVDACRSGGVTRVKGVKPAVSFAIESDDALQARGLAVITSSAAGEDSYESERLRASFFSHHLVTALRGAADADGDAKVALDEAYRYTYDQTLKSSGQTLKLQHPTFRFDVRGRGEVILTRLAGEHDLARLALPNPGTYLIVEGAEEGPVVAEASTTRPGSLMTLAPGRYFVQERQPEFYREYDIRLSAGEERSLADVDARTFDYARLVRKGGSAKSAVHGVRVHGGLRGEVLDGQGLTAQLVAGYGLDLRALSLGLRVRWSPPAALGAPSPDGLLREHMELGLGVTLQRFFDASWVSAGIGLLVEGAWHHQSFSRGTESASSVAGEVAAVPARDGFAGSFGLLASVQLPIGAGLQLELEGGPVATVYDRAVLSQGSALGSETAAAVTWFATGGLAWTF